MTSKNLKRIAAQNNEKEQVERKFRLRKALVMMLTIIVAMSVCVMPAFAGGPDPDPDITDIEGGIRMGLGEVYEVLTAVVVPLAAVCAVGAGLLILFNGQKGMDIAKKILIGIGIGVAVAFLAPLLVVTVAGWFKDIGDLGIFDPTIVE